MKLREYLVLATLIQFLNAVPNERLPRIAAQQFCPTFCALPSDCCPCQPASDSLVGEVSVTSVTPVVQPVVVLGLRASIRGANPHQLLARDFAILVVLGKLRAVTDLKAGMGAAEGIARALGKGAMLPRERAVLDHA